MDPIDNTNNEVYITLGSTLNYQIKNYQISKLGMRSQPQNKIQYL